MSEIPRWYRFAWFLGRAPDLTNRQWRVLGLVSAVSFFEMYDVYLFSLNLKQIQADLMIPEGDLGLLGSIVRAGALLSIFLAMAADRVGRRRMLLITVLGYTLLTGATALAPSAESFVVFQFLAGGFAVAEGILATVVIVEEFAPEHRGWGIGAAAAIQACGAGTAALMFGFVDYLPYGWRALYAFGLVPLLLIAYWRRTLPETDRFEAVARQRMQTPQLIVPMGSMMALMRTYPGRFFALTIASFVLSMAVSAASFFTPKYLQDVHLWSPANVALMTFFGGMFAILGNPLAGWMSDRLGRRPVAVGASVLIPVLTVGFFSVGSWALPLFWALLIFVEFAVAVTLSAFSAEMFPTSQRATATGTRSFASALGAVAGLAAISGLYDVLGDNWTAIRALAATCILVPVIIVLWFPETARRDLEEIAPMQAK